MSNGLVLCWSVVEYSHKPRQPALPYCSTGMGSSHGGAPVSLQPAWRDRTKWARFGHFLI